MGAWLQLTLSQGRNTILRQSLWRPTRQRKVTFQAFYSREWSQIEADGPGQIQGPLPVAGPSTDGHTIFWKGRSLFHSDAQVLFPRANGPATRIAFLLLQGTDSQLWTLEVDSRRADCWLRDVQTTDPPGWLSQDAVLVCRAGRQLLRVSASGQQVLYEGNGLSAPSLAPDGTRIAFISHPKDNNEIFVFDTATRKANNITHSDQGEIRPLWSAQGEAHNSGKNPELCAGALKSKPGSYKPAVDGRRVLRPGDPRPKRERSVQLVAAITTAKSYALFAPSQALSTKWRAPAFPPAGAGVSGCVDPQKSGVDKWRRNLAVA